MSTMRVLITGRLGLLGQALAALPRWGELGAHIEGYAKDELDLADDAAVRERLREAQPEVVFHLAAMTGVDECQRRPAEAERINWAMTARLAKACAEAGARMVYPSTDYVFDGRLGRPYKETDPPSPISVYGRTKLEGERHVLALGERGLVVRTSWLFGKAGDGKVCFVDRILGLARSRPELRVVSDECGRPTFAPHLASTMLGLVERGESGIWNVANPGTCTWYEFASEILRQAGIGTPVRPITAAEYGLPAPRPKYSVLDLDKLWAAGYTLPNWRDALAEYLRTGR